MRRLAAPRPFHKHLELLVIFGFQVVRWGHVVSAERLPGEGRCFTSR